MRTLFALLAGAAALVLAAPPAWAAPVVVTGAEVREIKGGVRLSLDLSGPAEPHVFALPAPRPRLVIDLPATVRLADGAGEALGGSGVAPGAGPALRLRYGPREAEASRLVLDLANPASEFTQRITKTKTGHRLVVEARIATPATVTVAKVEGPAPKPVSKVRRVVAIDAGHGGKDPGAIGSASATREKDVTLGAALALRNLLESRGYVVAMTREGDQYLTLPERVGVARRAQADLFISLHADSSPNAQTKGASIYTLSEAGSDRAKGEAQKRNWELDLESQPNSPEVEKILLDLAQRDAKNRSAQFARELQDALSPVAPMLQNAHRQRGFFVLLAPDMPAVLLEMGFLTNSEDEARVADPRRRREMMAAVADAVDSFFTAPADNAAQALARAP
jgi:N-acetylmuramoyl-L-alanine amidase